MCYQRLGPQWWPGPTMGCALGGPGCSMQPGLTSLLPVAYLLTYMPLHSSGLQMSLLQHHRLRITVVGAARCWLQQVLLPGMMPGHALLVF
jgi:hypothetical protein